MSKTSLHACVWWAALATAGCVGSNPPLLAPEFDTAVPSLPLEASAPRPREARIEHEGDTCRLVFGDMAFTFTAGSRRMLANDVVVWMNAAAEQRGRRWTIPAADARLTVAPLIHPTSYVVRAASPARVVLDPGHGGMDSGAVPASGPPEKTVALDLCRRVAALLEARGVRVHLTRTGDQDVPLPDRVRKAARLRATAFVSLHLNSARNAHARGLETYLLTPAGFASTAEGSSVSGKADGNAFDGANMILAYEIHRALLKRGKGPDRGVKRARFLVLRDAPCPAVLVETGFVSNAADARALRETQQLQRMAEGIADGIAAFLAFAVEPVPTPDE
jgi:N-acetylmuramoyl-L-alanine amidase